MTYGVNSIQIHKKLRLDKRAGSDNWYARLTLPNGKRLVKTTKTEDIESAKEVALRLFYEVDARIQHKLLAISRKLADVARHAIARMETEMREGAGKQAYRDYAQALNKWLIPYFGGTEMAKLDLAAVNQFDAWRTAQDARCPHKVPSTTTTLMPIHLARPVRSAKGATGAGSGVGLVMWGCRTPLVQSGMKLLIRNHNLIR